MHMHLWMPFIAVRFKAIDAHVKSIFAYFKTASIQ